MGAIHDATLFRPLDDTLAAPQITFTVTLEQQPRVTFDITDDASLCRLVDWMNAGAAQQLQELVADIVDALTV